MVSTAIASSAVSSSFARYFDHASTRKRRASSRDGVNIALYRLVAELAKIPDEARGTLRLSRNAYVAAVQDKPVVGVQLELVRHELQKLLLDNLGRLSGCDPRPVRHAEDMCVDSDRRLAERDVEDDVGGLAADPGQLFQRLAIRWDLPPVLAHQDFSQRDDILRLVAEEADRLHVRDQSVDAELDDRRGRPGLGKELRGRLVDTLVGRLPGEHNSDQELEGRTMLELRFRVRIGGTESLENRASLLRIHGVSAYGLWRLRVGLARGRAPRRRLPP